MPCEREREREMNDPCLHTYHIIPRTKKDTVLFDQYYMINSYHIITALNHSRDRAPWSRYLCVVDI